MTPNRPRARAALVDLLPQDPAYAEPIQIMAGYLPARRPKTGTRCGLTTPPVLVHVATCALAWQPQQQPHRETGKRRTQSPLPTRGPVPVRELLVPAASDASHWAVT
jgi:hypothetical protein